MQGERRFANKRIVIAGTALLLLGVFSGVWASRVQAAASIEETVVSPEGFLQEFKAGEEFTDTIYILRHSETDAHVDVRVTALSDALPDFARDVKNRSAASWITTSPLELTVPARSAEDVVLTVAVPDRVQGGEYYAVIEVRDSITHRVLTAIPVTFMISSGATTSSIVRFSAAERSMYWTNSVEVLTGFENTGNVSVVPTGSLRILQGGRTVASAVFNPTGETVYPGNYQLFEHPWRPRLALGRYTIVSEIVTDGGAKPFVMESIFWVFPWWAIAAGAVMGLLIVYLAYVGLRTFLWNRIMQKEVLYMQVLIASATEVDVQDEVSEERHE